MLSALFAIGPKANDAAISSPVIRVRTIDGEDARAGSKGGVSDIPCVEINSIWYTEKLRLTCRMVGAKVPQHIEHYLLI